MNLAEEFSSWSAEYTEKITRWIPYYREMIAGLIEYLPAEFQPKTILDLGCGNGNIVALLLRAFPDAQYTLVDASGEMLDLCRERFDGTAGMTFEESMFQDLTLPEHSVDLITAGFSFHHLNGPEKREIFQHAWRWLRPGGYLSMTDLYANKDDQPYYSELLAELGGQARALGTPSEEWEQVMEHHQLYDCPDRFTDQQAWLEEAGFSEVRMAWQKKAWGCVIAGR